MDQKVIAQEEGMSVSTFSRMLKKAEEMGYIKITVEYPVLSNEELSASLKKKYNLEKVFLVPKLFMVRPQAVPIILPSFK